MNLLKARKLHMVELEQGLHSVSVRLDLRPSVELHLILICSQLRQIHHWERAGSFIGDSRSSVIQLQLIQSLLIISICSIISLATLLNHLTQKLTSIS